jgi:hypothetical protein
MVEPLVGPRAAFRADGRYGQADTANSTVLVQSGPLAPPLPR